MSWPDLVRPSTTCGANRDKVVDGRHKAGHDTQPRRAAGGWLVPAMKPARHPAARSRHRRARPAGGWRSAGSRCCRSRAAAPANAQARRRWRTRCHPGKSRRQGPPPPWSDDRCASAVSCPPAGAAPAAPASRRGRAPIRRRDTAPAAAGRPAPAAKPHGAAPPASPEAGRPRAKPAPRPRRRRNAPAAQTRAADQPAPAAQAPY